MDIEIDHSDLACGEYLDRAGFVATEAGDKTMMRLLDSDGDHIVTVTRTIQGRDVQALLAYGKQERQLGEKLGRAQLQEQFRALLATDPA